MTAAKYNNHKTEVGGYRFDSKAESIRFTQLKLLEQAGVIRGLVLQPIYQLQPGFKDNYGHTHRAITYRPDFQYQEGNILITEDVKGAVTEVFKIKRKLFRYKYPHVELRVLDV